ncbi:MAG TPA: hypothetical protein VHZ51_18975 [Ktedonobacteraceae bacterium]|jgi:hypothetical protein|nr:hypothetical protein [Ktedonobacteraceae bacterium]
MAIVDAIIALAGIFVIVYSIDLPKRVSRVFWIGFGELVMFTIIMFRTGAVHP